MLFYQFLKILSFNYTRDPKHNLYENSPSQIEENSLESDQYFEENGACNSTFFLQKNSSSLITQLSMIIENIEQANDESVRRIIKRLANTYR